MYLEDITTLCTSMRLQFVDHGATEFLCGREKQRHWLATSQHGPSSLVRRSCSITLILAKTPEPSHQYYESSAPTITHAPLCRRHNSSSLPLVDLPNHKQKSQYMQPLAASPVRRHISLVPRPSVTCTEGLGTRLETYVFKVRKHVSVLILRKHVSVLILRKYVSVLILRKHVSVLIL